MAPIKCRCHIRTLEIPCREVIPAEAIPSLGESVADVEVTSYSDRVCPRTLADTSPRLMMIHHYTDYIDGLRQSTMVVKDTKPGDVVDFRGNLDARKCP